MTRRKSSSISIHNENNAITTVVLLNKPIRGFSNGGELRLLYSDIQNELVSIGIKSEQITGKLITLNVELQSLSPDEKSHLLKNAKPDRKKVVDDQLLRHTDAERLFGLVSTSKTFLTDSDITKNTFKVQHSVFGKTEGLFIPERFSYNKTSECISCNQCLVLLSPRNFVRHSHTPVRRHVWTYFHFVCFVFL